MAFLDFDSGDRFADAAETTLPKAFATARYAAPAVGHLCIQDTTALFNDGVVQAGASDIPRYLVRSVNSGNGTLSVIELPAIRQARFECTGSPALGNQIQAHGSAGTVAIGGNLRDRVKPVASGGTGTIVAIETGTPVFIRVEWP
jgi:hypothetical protein